MQCSVCKKQDHTVFHSSVYDKLICSQCYEEIKDAKTRSLLNFIIQILVAIAIIGAVIAIMFVNQSFAQVSDDEVRIANTQYDSIGTVFCCDGSRPPCTPTYALETRIVGWNLMYIQYERSYNYMVAWIPKYESRWRELK